MHNYAREGLDKVANSRGRDLGHVRNGLIVVGGALLLSIALGKFASHEAHEEEDERQAEGESEPRQLSAVWPPLFLALTISGFRIWNAPRSSRRDAALGLWGVVQALNIALMAFGPKRLGGQTGVAFVATGAALAYAKLAQRVDRGAAQLVTPFVGWGSIANLVADNVRAMPKRKTHPVQVTVH
jgi:tryptophan-rich sensory protein